ncbi:MAG: AtpZ/AtpI family protein [Geminicoccaceae bacterium]|nr:AtpZ/AtpI family protein [Geminicoccaceae bacterium]MCB9942522.1 AtpZ/AtpI family protein [Geminicoccaceae bacterium]
MSEDDRKPDFVDFDARLERLKASQPGSRDEDAQSRRRNASSAHAGLHVGIELIAGVLFGVVLGYFLDGWLDTRPVFLIIMLVLGTAAGTLNAYRYMKRLDRERAEQAEAGNER